MKNIILLLFVLFFKSLTAQSYLIIEKKNSPTTIKIPENTTISIKLKKDNHWIDLSNYEFDYINQFIINKHNKTNPLQNLDTYIPINKIERIIYHRPYKFPFTGLLGEIIETAINILKKSKYKIGKNYKIKIISFDELYKNV